MVYRACLPFKAMSVGVRAVVENEARHVLLVRHNYLPGWHFPGGGVEAGETAAAAARREAHEETGITVGALPVLFGVYLNRRLFGRDHVLVYRCPQWQRGEFRAGLEIADCRFFPVDALPQDVSPGTARRIGELYFNHPVSEFW